MDIKQSIREQRPYIFTNLGEAELVCHVIRVGGEEKEDTGKGCEKVSSEEAQFISYNSGSQLRVREGILGHAKPCLISQARQYKFCFFRL